MSKRIIVGVVLLLLFAVVAGIAYAQNVPRNNERWEYKLLSFSGGMGNNFPFSGNELIESANEYGKEGWELVTDLVSFNKGFLIFKRRLP